MTRTTRKAPLLLLASLLLSSACRSTPEPAPAAPARPAAAAAGLATAPSSSAPAREPLLPPHLMPGTRPAAPSQAKGVFQGRVVETFSAGPYTYVQVDSGSERKWAAAAEAAVGVGDLVRFSTAMPMANFESATLSRSFDLIYFVQTVDRIGAAVGDGSDSTGGSGVGGVDRAPGGGSAQTRPAAEDHDRSKVADAPALELDGIAPPEGGILIAAVHARAAELVGSEVLVRGRVVKFTPDVMDHNWLHVQDGSGEGPTADLTVITDGIAAIGDLVTVSGRVAVDRDLGFGYKYAVLLENALVTVE